ncbi:hypothetical protein [Marinilactibacillus psychrotolerans]|uniref:Uncharacterized protein n=1 Tax=Marinilactibacillus psychrotolerans TaxID=191770 RepID=A0AAV3WWE5_9LACT|nr:hypothetical protein [Marinilactibacillus psychrotolerans]GEL67220.1 hypothetical protein MPS01_13750 [Marinilactibacillus psychrotolerans]GEQ36024.1 hypothetical protein M132T_15320 [Marinilactibacillus psychrotolerans]SDC60227.1 hypothetical protein SAMN04488013_10736 [Marinilactibacillus psychrotolerans]
MSKYDDLTELEKVGRLKDHFETKTDLNNVLGDMSNHYNDKTHIEFTINDDDSSSGVYNSRYMGSPMYVPKEMMIEFAKKAISHHEGEIKHLIDELGGKKDE